MNTAAGWMQETLAQFGQQLGMHALEPCPDGSATLELEAGGLLGVEPGQGKLAEALVYLARPLGFEGGAVLRRALERAHHGAASPLPVQVAVRGGGPEALLLALVRVPEREFTVQGLSQAVDFLLRWCDGVRHG
jgi:type III secretion system chaperone SycN